MITQIQNIVKRMNARQQKAYSRLVVASFCLAANAETSEQMKEGFHASIAAWTEFMNKKLDFLAESPRKRELVERFEGILALELDFPELSDGVAPTRAAIKEFASQRLKDLQQREKQGAAEETRLIKKPKTEQPEENTEPEDLMMQIMECIEIEVLETNSLTEPNVNSGTVKFGSLKDKWQWADLASAAERQGTDIASLRSAVINRLIMEEKWDPMHHLIV